MDKIVEYTPILYSEEGKSIIEAVNALTPWDRYELVSKIGAEVLDMDWVRAHFDVNGEDDLLCPDTSTRDLVGDVFDNVLQKEVLEQMDDDDIVEVLLEKNMIPGILRDLTDEQLDEVIKFTPNKELKRITNAIINQINE